LYRLLVLFYYVLKVGCMLIFLVDSSGYLCLIILMVVRLIRWCIEL